MDMKPQLPKLLPDLMEAAFAGYELSSQQIQGLEMEVRQKPRNLPARAALLGCYFRRGFSSRQDRVNRRKHVVWMIQNEPSASFTGCPFASADSRDDKVLYKMAEKAWLNSLSMHTEPAALGNAAEFFRHNDDVPVQKC